MSEMARPGWHAQQHGSSTTKMPHQRPVSTGSQPILREPRQIHEGRGFRRQNLLDGVSSLQAVLERAIHHLERLPHHGVTPAMLDEFIVRAHLGDPSLVHHHDSVGVSSRLQAVGDDDGRTTARDLVNRGRDASLGREVEVRGRFVQWQERRIDELGSSERDELALTRRERPAALGEFVVIPAR